MAEMMGERLAGLWARTDRIFEMLDPEAVLASPFAGFPGFVAWIPAYSGYSADFFDGKHFVLKGGSWATAAELVRRSFRNWFQARYPHVFATFRCVADA